MTTIRVFPRRTKATPNDALALIGFPSLLDLTLQPDEVHVSVTFTWDMPLAEQIAEAWAQHAPTQLGGPATGQVSGNFTPGVYLKPGYVITSRGCPNRCWFCTVWKREGQTVRELPIVDGWNLLDDNLLACSEPHIRAVFTMLRRQHHRTHLTGGLEAARLQVWHADLLANLKPKQVFFAYDTPDDLEPLQRAGKMLLEAGFTRTSHALRAYVLIGFPRDTFDDAEKRLQQTVAAGFIPMAMLYRNTSGETRPDWRTFQRKWARPAIIASRCK